MGSKHSSPSEPTPRVMQMLAKSAHCPESVVWESYERFKSVAPKGKMDRKTFVNAYKAKHANYNAEGIGEIVFKYFDKDNSGHITFSEYFLPNAIINQTDDAQKAGIIFDICDQDKNGQVAIKELRALIMSLMVLKKEFIGNDKEMDRLIRNVFEEMDTDRSGKISQEEFVNAMMNNETIRKLLNFDYGN